jgi:anhydro-N-acetylmuramic acid kinase
VLAFDTGPANALIDAFARAAPGRHGGIDRDGKLSASGKVCEGLLAALARERKAFLDRAPPKSAGFEDFGPPLAEAMLRAFPSTSARDRVRTAVEFTALTVAGAYERHVLPRFPGLGVVRFSGGGTRNPTLMARLRDALGALGLRVEALPEAWSKAKEAVGFALLGDETLAGRPGNLPGATGAKRPVVLGKISL